MADADFDDFNDYEAYERHHRETVPAGARFQRLLNGAGAATSVALIVGLGFWAYELAMRDVQGIPVIRALEGPARVAPDKPGGDVALHQGLAVNRIAADGTAADAADTLTLAPRMADLAEADQPMGELAGSLAQTPVSGQQGPADGSDMTLSASVAPAAPVLPVQARPAEPLPDGPAELVTLEADTALTASLAVIPQDTPGVARSPRPLSRPAGDAMAEAAAAAVAAAMAPPPDLDVAPEALAEGTRLVQIGAYSNVAEAEKEWDNATERYGSLLDGKRRVIEPATSGGQMFYRLRVEGFTDIDDARRFCAALQADNAECVPAVVR